MPKESFFFFVFFYEHCHIFRFRNLFDITYQLFNSSAVILSKRCPAMPGMISNQFLYCIFLQIFTVIHFGELIAIGMRQFMVGRTVDSILVKEGRIEITF